MPATLNNTALLEYALQVSDFTGSRKNCHVPGLSSVVLFDRRADDGGMLRFFYTTPEENSLSPLFGPDGNFTLGVHNHRYDLMLMPLIGHIVNVEVSTHEQVETGDINLFEYAFSSGVDGVMSATPTRTLGLDRIQPVDVASGDSRSMDSTALHTVVVPRQDTPVAWLVHEGSPTGTESRIYSMKPDLTLNSDGLYDPMDFDEATAIVRDVLARIA